MNSIVADAHIVASGDGVLGILLLHALDGSGVPKHQFEVKPKEHRKHDCQNCTHRVTGQNQSVSESVAEFLLLNDESQNIDNFEAHGQVDQVELEERVHQQ